MSKNNLPIKVIMPRSSDIVNNEAKGGTTFFEEFTSDLQAEISSKFEYMLSYYDEVFKESPYTPAIGKITMKPQAIAKSHKPNDLCRKCTIIGSENLDEIYIKVTPQTISGTIKLVKKASSKKIKANMTAVSDISPITNKEKISSGLRNILSQNRFNEVKHNIKLKMFSFDDEYDDNQIKTYVMNKLDEYGFNGRYQEINYGEDIHLVRVETEHKDDIEKLSSINGIKNVDFFQKYALPLNNNVDVNLETILEDEYNDSEQIIGIIDGGISDNNPYLADHIYSREVYVPDEYQNLLHATFIASTIQYGNKLNNLPSSDKKRFLFLDVVAMPNSDPDFGEIDYISEQDLIDIIDEVMEKHSHLVKVWNMSIGIVDNICSDTISDFGSYLDYIQDKYNVQIFISSGNLMEPPYRTWPPQQTMGERDKIISPGDSVRGITVGSISLHETYNSIVKKDEPSPFSRRGPGPNHIIKPDIVDYGGNIDSDGTCVNIGIKGLGPNGNIIEGIGTSYSNPRAVQKYAAVYDELIEKDLLLAKAMTIHSARMNSRDLFEKAPENIHYFGFGTPALSSAEILQCSDDEITMIFKQKIIRGTHLEMIDFPYPQSLIRNNKYFGEIGMTLVYDPPVDMRFGQEYCRVNIDAHFGTYKILEDKIDFKGRVPLEQEWDEKYEESRVKHGFKWSPIKSYYRKFSKGIDVADGWKVRLDMTARNDAIINEQEFVLILTVKDSEGNDIYTELTNGLRSKGYNTINLETKQQLRQRQ